MSKEKIKRYSKSSPFGCRETYRLTPVRACLTFFSKLSICYHDKNHAPLYNQQEDVILGYESSWAGISKNADLR